MRAKVKITVISTGQEFLLLVAKMNLKGILVFSPQLIAPNSELILELKLGPGSPIMLKGFVHKASGDETSKKGMVIAFLNPSKETQQAIEAFMQQGKQSEASSAKKAPKKKAPPKPKVDKKSKLEEIKRQAEGFNQPEKTMIVDNTLPALALQSPDNSKELQVSTKDEENVHHAGEGFAGGETRHIQIHETLSRRKASSRPFRISMIYKAMGIVLLMVALVVFFRHGVGWIEKQFGIKLVTPPPATQPNTSQPLPTINAPSQTSTTPNQVTGTLDTIAVEDQGDFLKITLLGDGNYEDFVQQTLKDPYRIEFTFNAISTLNETLPKEINNTPVRVIGGEIQEGRLILNIELIEDEFLEVEAKPFPNAMDIFFYRE